MEKNPYAAPAPEVDASIPRVTTQDGQAWFAVGTRKLFVMSVLTFGLYAIHWFERQYRFQKRAKGGSLRPLARGIFSVFYANDLFRRIEGAAARADVGHSWTGSGMAGVYIASAVMSRFLDRVSDKLTTGTVSSVLALASIGLVFGLAYPLVQVQGTLNEVLARTNPGHDRNENFTVWNWLLMVLGGGLLGMGLFGVVAQGQ